MATTTNLGLTIIEENQSDKEIVVNNNSIALDGKLTATLDIATAAGGTFVVTSIDFISYSRLRLTGAPAAAIILELPSIRGKIIISNESGQDCTIRSSATPGDTLILPNGGIVNSFNTGTDGNHVISLSGITEVKLLTDYEEGVFTPSLVAGTSGTITLDSTSDTLSYTKIGNKVFVTGLLLVLSVSTPLGSLRLTGLPFTSANLAENGGSSGFYVFANNLTGVINTMQGRITELTSEVQLTEFDGTTSVDDLANHIQAATFLAFDFSYPV